MIKGLAGNSALERLMKKNFFSTDPFPHEQEVALEPHWNRKYHEKVFPKSNVVNFCKKVSKSSYW